MHTALNILDSATALISTPNAWCRRDRAQDASGNLVNPWSPKAVRWDITGAIWRASSVDGKTPQEAANIVIASQKALRALSMAVGLDWLLDVDTWQDIPSRTHAEVLSLLAAARDLLDQRAVPAHTAQPIQHAVTVEP